MGVTVCKDDLMRMGYKKYQAISLVRQAKAIMVQRGCPYYNNYRFDRLPREVIEEILGVSFEIEKSGINE